MARGGHRSGAGRKAKAVLYERPIIAAERKICDHLPELVDLQLSLARGVRVQDDSGNVYTTEPDFRAISYLLDRIMGKPTQAFDLHHEIAALSDDELVARAAGLVAGADS